MSEKRTVKQYQKEAFTLYKGNKYWEKDNTYKWLPVISACPTIESQPVRPFTARSLVTRQPIVKIKSMPRYCHIRKVINYPFRKMGAPMMTFVGNYGTGKSILKNLFKAFYLARGIRILEFNDRRLECRNLACHGWFDKNGKFYPFPIDIWIPKDYTFKKIGKKLWDFYPNVHLCYFDSADQIIDSMSAHKLTVVFEECFTPEGKLKLWLELMNLLTENLDLNIINMFSHHELARLIPETPRKEIYKLVHEASDVCMNLRKDRVGLITCYHIISEVFFRVSQKFGYLIFKRPVNRSNMTQAEKDAKGYGVRECNISMGGYWMKHTIDYFPELPDIFRMIPQKDKLTFPELEFESEANTNEGNNKHKITITEAKRYHKHHILKETVSSIAKKENVTDRAVWYSIENYIKKMELLA